jgi:hypothetical protein
VLEYSRLYSHQAMFAVQQARAMELLTAALAVFSDDPLSAKPAELEKFVERLQAMSASTIVEDQLADRLLEDYTRMIAR